MKSTARNEREILEKNWDLYADIHDRIATFLDDITDKGPNPFEGTSNLEYWFIMYKALQGIYKHYRGNYIRYRNEGLNNKSLTESKLRKIIKESVMKVMKEAAFYPNYPENTIENTIWNQYNLPWNQVEESPERYNGVWFISVDYFEYTAHLGNAKAYGKFKSLEECLEYAQNFSFEAAYDLYCEQLSVDEDDEGFTSISLNIMCKCEDGTYEVANTKLYEPN